MTEQFAETVTVWRLKKGRWGWGLCYNPTEEQGAWEVVGLPQRAEGKVSVGDTVTIIYTGPTKNSFVQGMVVGGVYYPQHDRDLVQQEAPTPPR